jgi:hypothetical protein
VYVYEKIDWLSVTFPENVGLKSLVKYLPDDVLKRIKSPIPVYSQAYEYSGVKFLLGHPHSGIHVILSGKPLDALRISYGYSIDNVYSMIADNVGKPSRIDLAVDVMAEQAFSVDSVYKRYEKNECATRLKGSKFIGEHGRIETFYIGNIKSKSRKVRVYDKGLEQGGEIDDWVRVEYEKRRGATATYNAVVSGQKISSIIRGAVDFPTWPLWVEIMGSASAIIPRIHLSQENDLDGRIEWIRESAAPAIAKVAFEQMQNGNCLDIHDAPIFDALSDAIATKLRELLHRDTISNELVG